MAETSFRAVFEAEDRSFSSAMRQMRDDSKLMATDMIADANRIAEATDQKVNKVLQDQIALYEKNRELAKREERMKLDSRYSGAMQAATTDMDRSRLKEEWDKGKENLKREHAQDDMQVGLLKEIIYTLRDTAQRELASDEKHANERMRAVRDGATGKMSTEEEYIARTQLEMTGGKGGKSRSMLADVFLGTMLGQAVMGAGQKFAQIGQGAMQASDAEVVTAQMWSAIPYIGDALSAAHMRHLELSEQSDRMSMGLMARGVNIKTITGAGGFMANLPSIGGKDQNSVYDEDQWRAQLDSAAVKYNEYAELRKREWSAATSGYAWQDPSGYKAQADAMVTPIGALTKKTPWSYTEAGIDRNEFLTLATQLLPMLGTGTGLAANTRALIDITQGGGISSANAMSAAKVLRLGGGGSLRAMMGEVVGSINAAGINPALRDEMVGDIMGLTQGMYDSGFGNVDVGRMSRVRSTFQRNYGDALGSIANIQAMMSSMANPQTDYQQAINYRIYAAQRAKEGKATSYLDFMKWQEDPSQGLLGGKMEYLSDVYGTGEFGAMAFKAAGIGRKWQASEAYLKAGAGGLSAAELGVSSASATFDATQFTTERQKQQAEITTAFTQGMTEGMTKVFEQIGDTIAKKISEAGFPAGDEIAKWIRSMAADPNS